MTCLLEENQYNTTEETCSSQFNVPAFVEVGKEWANHLLKVDALSCQGGRERMGWPSFSPPSKKQRLYVYS